MSENNPYNVEWLPMTCNDEIMQIIPNAIPPKIQKLVSEEVEFLKNESGVSEELMGEAKDYFSEFIYRPNKYYGPIALDATPSKECDEYHKNSKVQVNLPPLHKGKYDIHYVINLLKTIESKCESGKHQPKDTLFTLRESVRRLLAMLEVEALQ